MNPETAERDADPVRELRQLYGHADLGIHAEVIEGGRFAVGDAIEVLPDLSNGSLLTAVGPLRTVGASSRTRRNAQRR